MQKKKVTTVPFHKKKFILIGIAASVIVVIGLVSIKIANSILFPKDMQCYTLHETTTKPPANLTTAMDYFLMGDYDYDRGDCQAAIADYTKSIDMNPQFPEGYNNRAYTYMRLHDYQAAIGDLDKAIELRPDYVNALMNRGDIYNFYYAIDYKKALADYDKILELGPGAYHDTSLCGHRILAKDHGWSLQTLIDIVRHLPVANGACGK